MAVDEARLEDTPANHAARLAARGAFLAVAQTATVDERRAYAVGFGGYDSARSTGTFEAATELRLFGPVALRGAAVYTNSTGTARPSFGARAQVLREDRQGVDAAVGLFYRPEGLTEPEGEIESVVSLGRHLGRTYLLGNLLYGQDPEGNERDGEVRMAALRPLAGRLLLGFDGRVRFDLGSSAAKLAARREALMDAMLGPTVSALVGPVVLLFQGGGSALRLQQQVLPSFGGFVLVGIGTAL